MPSTERFLWDHVGEWIGGAPSAAVVEFLGRRGEDPAAIDAIRYLAPDLIGASDARLRSAALQHMGRVIEAEEAQRAACARAVEAWSAAGIDPLFVKGMDLRYRLYDSPARRPANDVDVIVDPARYEDAVATLLRIGGRRHGGPGPHEGAREQESSWTVDGASIDVHRSMLQVGRGPIDFAELRARSETVVVGDVSLRVPCREHAAALCLVHIGRHEGATEFVHLRHGIDVLLLATRWDLDWADVAACARRWRCARLAGAGLWTWRDAFGDRIPGRALAALDPGWLARTCARRSRATLSRSGARPPGVGRAAQLALKWVFAEDARDRVWLVRELASRRSFGRR